MNRWFRVSLNESDFELLEVTLNLVRKGTRKAILNTSCSETADNVFHVLMPEKRWDDEAKLKTKEILKCLLY